MSRKRWGVVLIVTGIVTAGAGVIVYFTTADPTWLKPALGIVSFIANAIGLPLAFIPDTKPPA